MNYLSISDIHFGHRRTPTKHIVKNFYKYVLNEANRMLDVIFIAGDIYDRLLDANSEDFLRTITLFGHLLDYCHANDIKLRVLEGTPSHDWQQPKVLEHINACRESPIDLKYFDVLKIDYMEEFDKHILYIPDEWSTNREEIETQISEQLKEHHIEQVDIAIMHGQFNYQMLDIPNPPFCYDEDYFLKLVKSYIHIGHFHKRSCFDRIHASGSFDRVAHNEEGAKGYDRVVDGVLGFVENEDAFKFVTLPVTKKDTLASMDKKILSLPKGSFVRISMKKDHPFNLNFREFASRYIHYVVDKKLSDEPERKAMTHILDGVSFNNSTSGVVGDLFQSVIKLVTDKVTLTDRQTDKLKTYLEPFKHSVNKEEEI